MTKTTKQQSTCLLLVGAGVPFLLLCLHFGHSILSRPARPADPEYCSYDELISHGFYVLVLPEDQLTERGWEQRISLSSWDVHCGLLIDDTYNPLRVAYYDPSGRRMFALQLGPWGMVWNHSQIPTNLDREIETEWIEASSLSCRVRKNTDGTIERLYRLNDFMGLGLDIRSSLSVAETIELIEQLEYVGPPLEDLVDPWNCGR